MCYITSRDTQTTPTKPMCTNRLLLRNHFDCWQIADYYKVLFHQSESNSEVTSFIPLLSLDNSRMTSWRLRSPS